MAIHIIDVKALQGPNIFHHKPVMKMRIDLGELVNKSSAEWPGFTERLTALLPNLYEHRCSPGYRGGFIERLRRGTYLGHIIEHVALELSGPAQIKVGFGKTIYGGSPGVYDVIVRYQNHEAMEYILQESVRIVESVILREPVDLAPIIERAKEIKAETDLGPSATAIVTAAEKRNIPWQRLGYASLVQLGYGALRRRVQAAVTDNTSLIAKELVQDKAATKRLLQIAAVGVSDGFSARRVDEVKKLFPTIKPPLVVKPIDSHHGLGITMGITTIEDALKACATAWEYSAEVLIEEECQGKDYRLLVINKKFVAAAERVSAHVIGDGKSTIEELVAIANKDPRRGKGHGSVLTQIELDESSFKFLASQGLNKASVPKPGQIIKLVQVANLSKGGTARDVTDMTHESIRSLSERVARIVDLDICGIDLIHYDIRKPLDSSTKVIEVNAGPGLRMHIAPSEGKSRDVGKAIIDMLYPTGSGRIPIVSVTGTNGKTTTARLISHIAGIDGKVTGLTCSDGILIGGKYIERGDTTGPRSARALLSDPAVELAVLETARGGLMRNGLGYDWSDVGIITNIRPDHFGQDGIETIEDLIRVKSLVAERVREGGTIVLNADDLEASRLIKTAKLDTKERNIVYYSTLENHPLIIEHVHRGGEAFCQRNGWICELSGGQENYIVRVADLKFALGGHSHFNLSNAIAAATAARALGLTHDQIRIGLQSFSSTLHNIGRFNIYRVNEGHVIIDYAHNPDAIMATGKMVKEQNPRSMSAILGLPGDRTDSLLEECARSAARQFDSIILRDDKDLRGRRVGEVPTLLSNVFDREFPNLKYQLATNDVEALRMAVSSIRPGDVIIAFCDDYHGTMSELRKFDPIPVENLAFDKSEPVIDSQKVVRIYTEHVAAR